MITSKDVWKIQNSKVIVHFDEDSGQPIGESGGLLGSWLGQLSNDLNLLPINYSDWRLVNSHIKTKVWESKLWFDDPPMRKVFVMSALGNRCKDVKLCLWKEYKRNSLSETLLNRPEMFPKINGTIKTEKRPCRAEFFIETRTKPNRTFVCEEAETRAEALMILLGKNSHVENNTTGSLDDEYAQNFGLERP
ncbi:hypothetical protein N665_0489s0002 [Sinapis alba]|nr:hypothetical protein N665_0489s0002 [Sinapis alba]